MDEMFKKYTQFFRLTTYIGIQVEYRECAYILLGADLIPLWSLICSFGAI